MANNYVNEKLLTESILNHYNNVDNCCKYIRRYFKVESYYDNNLSLLYIWENSKTPYNLNQAYSYLQQNIAENMCEIVFENPNIIESQEGTTIYVVYYHDGSMDSIYYTEDEAKDQVNKLNKEYPDNKAFYKKELTSTYEK